MFYACFELLSWIFSIQMSLWVCIQHNILFGHSYDVLFKDYMQQETYFFITTNAPHSKENGRNGGLKFFSQGLEEMHQELSKDGEDHKLGDVKTTPLDLHTLSLHTSNFCFSIETLYRINLEHLFVWFDFYFVRPPHYHSYIK